MTGMIGLLFEKGPKAIIHGEPLTLRLQVSIAGLRCKSVCATTIQAESMDEAKMD
jgi:hypothetical protein